MSQNKTKRLGSFLSWTQYSLRTKQKMRPKVSAVLTQYLKQCNEPPWTSYFIRVLNLFIVSINKKEFTFETYIFHIQHKHNKCWTISKTNSIAMCTMTNGENHISIGHWIMVQIIIFYELDAIHTWNTIAQSGHIKIYRLTIDSWNLSKS